jgi:hypothetical protein
MNEKLKAIIIVSVCTLIMGCVEVQKEDHVELEEICERPEFREDFFSFQLKEMDLSSHLFSVTVEYADKDLIESISELEAYGFVSAWENGSWVDISCENKTVDGNESVFHDFVSVPDGYHKVTVIIRYKDELTAEWIGFEQSLTIESVLGRPRSWKVVDKWP